MIAASWLLEAYPAWSKTLQGTKCRLLEKSAGKHQAEVPSPNQADGLQRVAVDLYGSICEMRILRVKSSPEILLAE